MAIHKEMNVDRPPGGDFAGMEGLDAVIPMQREQLESLVQNHVLLFWQVPIRSASGSFRLMLLFAV